MQLLTAEEIRGSFANTTRSRLMVPVDDRVNRLQARLAAFADRALAK